MLVSQGNATLQAESDAPEDVESNDLGGVTKNYESMGIYMFQTFFDKLSSDFIPGIIGGLDQVKFNHTGTLSLLDEDLVFNYELEDIHIASATIDPTPPIITINNGSVTLAVKNLNLNVTADYSYISEPPIFADIGEASIHFADMTLSTDMSSKVQPFQVELSNMKVDAQAEPFCSFDGISDFSQVATNVVNTVAAVVRNRLESLINGGELYSVDKKVEAIINKILGLIEFPIHLGESGLYLDGVFYSDIMAANDVLVLPLDVMLRYEDTTFDSSVCSFSGMHAVYQSEKFDLQLTVQDCAVNELLFTLY